MTIQTSPAAARFTAAPSAGSIVARAFWSSGKGTGEIRDVEVAEPGQGEVLVRSLFSAISRGTESLVWSGRVPAASHQVMRAQFQQGDFPGPVKYGYLNVGVVEIGPAELLGRTVFCLHPHQSAYVVPASSVTPVPEGVPAERAVLAGMVETALNSLWDVPPLLGDRLAVVGAGALGCGVARLAMRIPGVEVTLVDVDPTRAEIAARLGVAFASPDDAPTGLDTVFHTSATSEGLRRSMQMLRREGTVVELSWFGEGETPVALGDVFHSERLTLRASQVGTLAGARRDSRTHADRLALALRLLGDDAFDALLTTTSTFSELPEVMSALVTGEQVTLTHLVRYEGASCSP